MERGGRTRRRPRRGIDSRDSPHQPGTRTACGDRSGIAGVVAFGFVSAESAPGRSAKPRTRRAERNGTKSRRPDRAGQAAPRKSAGPRALKMETRERSPQVPTAPQGGQQIVPTASRGLALRSAALVMRGLRDMARDSNWLIKKVFPGYTPRLAISATGALSLIAPPDHGGSQRVVLYDIERPGPTLALAVPQEAAGPAAGAAPAQDFAAAFAWSSSARHLVAAWDAWQPALHIFDLQGKLLLGTFGEFKNFPACLAWSGAGKFFAAAS